MYHDQQYRAIGTVALRCWQITVGATSSLWRTLIHSVGRLHDQYDPNTLRDSFGVTFASNATVSRRNH